LRNHRQNFGEHVGNTHLRQRRVGRQELKDHQVDLPEGETPDAAAFLKNDLVGIGESQGFTVIFQLVKEFLSQVFRFGRHRHGGNSESTAVATQSSFYRTAKLQ